ncbi:MAG: hypothetical protein HKP37_03000 [Boseongicola sp.]|nr:hypothetical protein [Boseongicola sp.]NNL17688.1 hypothetical protein [Boseongicola sp.]
MALIIAALLVIVFVANVIIGSMGDPILGNVAEMLLLFGASGCFVYTVLKKEAAEKSQENQD